MSNQDLMSAHSALALFETTKAQREQFAALIIDEIKEGRTDPLKVHMQLKSCEHLMESVKENPEYKELVLEAASKHGKRFETYNAEFETSEAGVKWDYSQTGDTVLDELMATKAELDAKIKDRQKFLQTIPESGMADPENGNMLYRASKSSTTIIKCKLK